MEWSIFKIDSKEKEKCTQTEYLYTFCDTFCKKRELEDNYAFKEPS